MERERTIRVAAMTRVEGEGGLLVRLHGNDVQRVQLNIFEPPRFFEALLRGRRLEEVPDITARICGICPVAYQMSTVHALERGLGVSVTPEIRQLRRLLYCGEWIESHALHVHLLNAPDFLHHESGLSLAREQPVAVERGLRLKKHGNQLLEVLGGRAIHPINVAVGGFYHAPRRAQMAALIPDFEWSLEAAIEATRWVAKFDFPDLSCEHDFVALTHPDEYAMNEGRIATSNGPEMEVAAFESEFEEQQVPHSTALHCVRKSSRTSYLVGPLARLHHNRNRLSPRAMRLADELPLEWPCTNPFKSILARGLELVHAFEEALEILRTYRPPKPARVAYEVHAAEGCAATEAPRGLLYHHYAFGDDGLIRRAKIVPPTSQNQGQIELDLARWVPRVLGADDAALATSCEQLVRCYDPCISCSTHFLRLRVERV